MQTMGKLLLYKDLSYKIIGTAREVYKELGPGSDGRKQGHKKDNKSGQSPIDQLSQNNSLESGAIR